MGLKLLLGLLLTALFAAPIGYAAFESNSHTSIWAIKAEVQRAPAFTASPGRSLAPGYQSWWRAWAPIGLSAGGATRSSAFSTQSKHRGRPIGGRRYCFSATRRVRLFLIVPPPRSPAPR